ncbi:uncharacterized protein EI97DRAFT_503627 [Westerdykella ornata]|uniref:Uncharacterized protein n=1 Tax=Westerdykella ornata TaxID=318751 RepID=A0A6A6JA95_WESOR|nr:uncharacterized protein EI97DRAFT_503627 [Westerdykella ornata]KAF2273177.1 hypothetical protein EI97DRAFT_503627 [Westerdykella ornata]
MDDGGGEDGTPPDHNRIIFPWRLARHGRTSFLNNSPPLAVHVRQLRFTSPETARALLRYHRYVTNPRIRLRRTIVNYRRDIARLNEDIRRLDEEIARIVDESSQPPAAQPNSADTADSSDSSDSGVSNMDQQQPQQQRRPARAHPASRRTAASTSHRRGQNNQANSGNNSERSGASSVPFATREDNPDNDLVERDANGEIIINSPELIPPQPGDPDYNLPTEDPEIARQNELIALYGQHGNNLEEGVMEEVRTALRASLNRIVASLDDDRWMFEPESDARPKMFKNWCLRWTVPELLRYAVMGGLGLTGRMRYLAPTPATDVEAALSSSGEMASFAMPNSVPYTFSTVTEAHALPTPTVMRSPKPGGPISAQTIRLTNMHSSFCSTISAAPPPTQLMQPHHGPGNRE